MNVVSGTLFGTYDATMCTTLANNSSKKFVGTMAYSGRQIAFDDLAPNSGVDNGIERLPLHAVYPECITAL